jgi:hypothetical protein
MGSWTPNKEEKFIDANGDAHTLYLWIADGNIEP